MDWSTRACARTGHVTFHPDGGEFDSQLSTMTPVGIAWKCLRCGAFIPGEPFLRGPADEAPKLFHDRKIRDRFLIRLLAVERFVRGLLVLALAWAVEAMRDSQVTLSNYLATSIPQLSPFAKQIGWDIEQSKVIHFMSYLIESTPHTLYLIFIALIFYGLLQVTEGVGLWLIHRWAEYLTVVATSLFLPIEIYEIMHGATFIKVGALVVNIAAVMWLVWSKYLFGFNGGKTKHEEEFVVGRSAIEYAITLRSTKPEL